MFFNEKVTENIIFLIFLWISEIIFPRPRLPKGLHEDFQKT